MNGRKAAGGQSGFRRRDSGRLVASAALPPSANLSPAPPLGAAPAVTRGSSSESRARVVPQWTVGRSGVLGPPRSVSVWIESREGRGRTSGRYRSHPFCREIVVTALGSEVGTTPSPAPSDSNPRGVPIPPRPGPPFPAHPQAGVAPSRSMDLRPSDSPRFVNSYIHRGAALGLFDRRPNSIFAVPSGQTEPGPTAPGSVRPSVARYHVCSSPPSFLGTSMSASQRRTAGQVQGRGGTVAGGGSGGSFLRRRARRMKNRMANTATRTAAPR